MAKFDDAIRNTLITYFQTGDQPTQAQFTEWITRLQEGIEDHDHDGTGDGDGIATLGGVLTIHAATSRVGIGELTPDVLLHLKKASGPFIVIEHTATNTNQGIHMYEGANVKGVIQLFGSTYAVADNQDSLHIYSLDGHVVLQPVAGCVGINITAPTALLHLDGDNVGSGIKLTRGTLTMQWSGTNNGPGYIGCASNDDLHLQTNAANRISIAAAGAVKITNLAGVGVRAVVAAADGTLSAP